MKCLFEFIFASLKPNSARAEADRFGELHATLRYMPTWSRRGVLVIIVRRICDTSPSIDHIRTTSIGRRILSKKVADVLQILFMNADVPVYVVLECISGSSTVNFVPRFIGNLA
jgi:hypothetical protein